VQARRHNLGKSVASYNCSVVENQVTKPSHSREVRARLVDTERKASTPVQKADDKGVATLVIVVIVSCASLWRL